MNLLELIKAYQDAEQAGFEGIMDALRELIFREWRRP